MARNIGSRYTTHQILGRGSAGTVWLGEGPEGPVAVKLLREDLASDQELVGRFVQERTALLGLDHPRVVKVRDLVVDGNDLALVMDLVRGTDLRTRLDRERRLAPEAAVAIVADVADALAAAHAAGIVHRDVKPENILLDMEGPLGPGAVLRRHVTETVVPLPGIPEELWQLVVQCLAKAPASRLRASELATRLRDVLPMLKGIPPLDVDEPDAEPAQEPYEEDTYATATGAGEPGPRRAAVPLVPGASADSNRDTHTSMRVPAPDELSGGPLGTARAPRPAGARRPGSARHKAGAVRKRRITLTIAAVVVAGALGAGGYLAASGDAEGPPQDSKQSSLP
ncbi:protein kinase domain-containing protein [Streptomyces venezuelae]|uniref:protein kinase domain-containing protein n=1 Tax=Streptomyces venezuelae TaxID=54571 RepID=UPI001F27F0EE|nr:protein kinase [Streptomyces venezuelae]